MIEDVHHDFTYDEVAHLQHLTSMRAAFTIGKPFVMFSLYKNCFNKSFDVQLHCN